ncbi:MAG: aspartate carbamoyltransferase catalytic subunit [Pseudomonadota bacterium]|nr:aspartate carbamoyltransferase catalytic subunit [Pseudomonadota bacterium]|tara:strand:+ start:963 stop:1949 length:987 start_codon:yes stop_codon:yes gene_type:complete
MGEEDKKQDADLEIDSKKIISQKDLRHFIDIEYLSKDLVIDILDLAESFAGVSGQPVKKVPLLRGKTIVNLFFESSTRTRTTFELAAKRLSADILNINVDYSATKKGESLLDTLKNLEAMHCDMFIVRHPSSGAAKFISENVSPDISVINAGDGRHSHPTQAMLDVFTIRKYFNNFKNIKVAIVGDILHSRVARSLIHALRILEVPEIRLVAPKTLMPVDIEDMGVKTYVNMDLGISDCNVVIMLRLQNERMNSSFIPDIHEYYKLYGFSPERLEMLSPDGIVMHPGPVNRGVEMSSEVADCERSVILQQVSNGIAVRMAILSLSMQP